MDRRGLMAVKNVRVVICDKCGTDVDTERWTVTFPEGQKRTFDLCPPCAEPLRELTELLDKVGDRGPKTHQQPVLSRDEVAAAVRKAKRPARKASTRPRK